MESTAAVRGSTLQLEKKKTSHQPRSNKKLPYITNQFASCNVKFVIESCMSHNMNFKTSKSAKR